MAEKKFSPEPGERHEHQQVSNSVGDTLGKLWNKFIQKEATEAEKLRMANLLNTQKQQLSAVINKYKVSTIDIVGESNQNKLSLLSEVKRTINDLKNMSGDITDQQR